MFDKRRFSVEFLDFQSEGGFVKYPSWKGLDNEGRVEALINSIGGEETAEGLISGEVTAKVKGNVMEMEDAIRVLLDRHGRCIPRNLENNVCDANCEFHLVQPKLDYGLRLARLNECLQAGPVISGAEFEDRCQKLLERLGKDEQCANVVKAVHLPICIPQTHAADYGSSLVPFLLAAVR